MKYIVNNSNDPAYNIALEAYAFKELTDIDEIFILWINEPAIIIGKHQNAIEEINKEFTDEKGIHVVRRLSGGGAVYHDLNNLNYTIISNKADEGALTSKPSPSQLLILWQHWVLRPISQAVMTWKSTERKSVVTPKPMPKVA